ncbi:unnamed protein product, partial [marine sediment metagenome]
EVLAVEGENNIEQTITRISDYEVEVTLTGIQNTDVLTFESTGDLNVVTEQYEFDIQVPPVIVSANITPSTANTSDTIVGSCNATDVNLGNVSYYYEWYKNDVLNDSGVYGGDYCYQETANVSTACGGLSTGSYVFDVTFSNPENLIDGNWSTASGGNWSVNYTIPVNTESALIQIKDSDVGTINYTIPSDCLSGN